MQHKIFARDTLGIYGFEVVRSAACSNDEFSLVEWTSFSGVMFAKCAHGYYFVYKKLHFASGEDRWFTEYEPSTDKFADQGGPFAASPSFEKLEEAWRYCEENAQVRAAAFGSQPLGGRASFH
jgi:hypothetical protein